MATRKIVPRADNEGGLGTALKRWASAFITVIACTTINALTLAAASVGFTISGGTTSKTLTVDETVTMSDKAPKTDIIKGDGTAGRVLRLITVAVQNGTNAGTIKVKSLNVWNGDAIAEEDNLAKGGDTGVFALNAGGFGLYINTAGISGDPIAILSCVFRFNYTGSELLVDGFVEGANIRLNFFNRTSGLDADLTVLVDTGIFYFYILYLTSA